MLRETRWSSRRNIIAGTKISFREGYLHATQIVSIMVENANDQNDDIIP